MRRDKYLVYVSFLETMLIGRAVSESSFKGLLSSSFIDQKSYQVAKELSVTLIKELLRVIFIYLFFIFLYNFLCRRTGLRHTLKPRVRFYLPVIHF